MDPKYHKLYLIAAALGLIALVLELYNWTVRGIGRWEEVVLPLILVVFTLFIWSQRRARKER